MYPDCSSYMKPRKLERRKEYSKSYAGKMAAASHQPTCMNKAPHYATQQKRPRAAEKREWGVIKASEHSKNTVNPIRKIVDSLNVPHNPEKEPIRLNLGDPTVLGNLPPCDVAVQALEDVIREHKFDGYGPAVGAQCAREAVAKKFTHPNAPITADDVILASGCSHALEMAIVAIADPGENILVPNPGFPLYTTLCKPNGIETLSYNLKMEHGGIVDLVHLESLINDKTRAIIVNNPSNPTGVVFTKEHLEEILRLAYKHKLPIIADEIYGDLTYDGATFHPMATLSPQVPIISCDGIAKRYLVPGWRMGWVIVHDRFGALTEVKQGMVALSMKIVGPCALVQGALPRILQDTPQSFFDHIKEVLSANANAVYKSLSRIPGLKPLKPQGAMYMMIGFDDEIYGDETKLMQDLIKEESVICLPGSAFNSPNWFRLVLTYPLEVTEEACERISEFCLRRLKLSKAYGPLKNTEKDDDLDSCGQDNEDSSSLESEDNN
jgi:tyrosine aminotransferase